jgi:HSP20 family protein
MNASAQSTTTRSPSSSSRTDASIDRGERQRAIETGRDQGTSSNLTRRGQTSIHGPGTGRFTPFTLMQRMAEDFDRLFENLGFTPGTGVATSRWSPSRDLWSGDGGRATTVNWMPQLETFRRGDKFVVRADLPGLDKKDVDVTVENGLLTISGERRDEHEDTRDGFYQTERSYGSFYRALALPDGVSEDQCEATFKDGVLEVTLPAPKETQQRAKQIPIR